MFTYAKPPLHGQVLDGKVVINLENFIEDIEEALLKLFLELDNDPVRQKKAEERFDKIGLIGIARFVTTPEEANHPLQRTVDVPAAKGRRFDLLI